MQKLLAEYRLSGTGDVLDRVPSAESKLLPRRQGLHFHYCLQVTAASSIDVIP